MGIFCTVPLKNVVGRVVDKMQFMAIRGSVQDFGVDEMMLALELFKFDGVGGDEG